MTDSGDVLAAEEEEVRLVILFIEVYKPPHGIDAEGKAAIQDAVEKIVDEHVGAGRNEAAAATRIRRIRSGSGTGSPRPSCSTLPRQTRLVRALRDPQIAARLETARSACLHTCPPRSRRGLVPLPQLASEE